LDIWLLLRIAFAALGIIFLLDLTLPAAVTAFAGVPAPWWLAGAITLIIHIGKITNSLEEKTSRFHRRSKVNARSLQIVG
jgi:hypothetical protein